VSFDKHEEAIVAVAAPPEAVFAYLDDPRSLGGHMEKPSAMMMGGSMRYAFDAAGGRAVGSVITMKGDVLGVDLGLEQVVTERTSSRKVWDTRGEPHLLVMGAYRMGFDVAPAPGGSILKVFIDFNLPQRGFARVLGALFGRLYARWCVQRMTKDAARHFRET
jgi:hypothetical protein